MLPETESVDLVPASDSQITQNSQWGGMLRGRFFRSQASIKQEVDITERQFSTDLLHSCLS